MGRKRDRRKQERFEKYQEAAPKPAPARIQKRKAPPLRPLTQNQAEYFHLIDTYNMVFASGYPGTSKTYVATRIACQMFKAGLVKQIVLMRAAVSDEDIGAFKGTRTEKMMNWLMPVMSALREEFAYGQLVEMLQEDIEQIVLIPVSLAKGMSFKEAFVIVDEAEDVSVPIMRNLLTRIGEASKMVFCGDIAQSDLGEDSGFAMAIDRWHDNPKLRAICGHIDFDDYRHYTLGGDVVRSKEAAIWVEDLYA